MKRLVMVIVGICLLSTGSFVAFAQNNPTREEYCTAQRKQCVKRYIRTNIHGVRFVTPEGTKICWAQYRQCMGQ